ncbi:hypothetical protein P7K49_039193 [Saguinus oedipus]|uniref:Uncharacterized protein n=1 Tax=Saguinus oedipus TaxID=9490 RepID=A0ABQ9TGT3_SAGOE|nr:hypothetical protein P7K49_039193 [Saguinus oedipus]
MSHTQHTAALQGNTSQAQESKIMGTNKVASQKGMSVYGLGRQVYDPKYCAAPTEPVIHNGSQGTGTNGSELSDSDYQAEYPDEYHGEYQDDYPRDYPYSDQGIDY